MNYPNSNITFSFKNQITVAAYSLTSTLRIYPKSWDVYYALNDDDWKLLHHQSENEYLSKQYTTKKFRVKPTIAKKIKIIQRTSYNYNNPGYDYCFALRRVEFFGIQQVCTMKISYVRFKPSVFAVLMISY